MLEVVCGLKLYFDNKLSPQDIQTYRELSCLVNEIVEILMDS